MGGLFGRRKCLVGEGICLTTPTSGILTLNLYRRF